MRVLLPVDQLLPVEELGVAGTHAVVRVAPQGLGGDGHRLRRREPLPPRVDGISE